MKSYVNASDSKQLSPFCRKADLIVLASFFLFSQAGIAATISVSPGDSVKTKIMSAKPGDLVLFEPGTYLTPKDLGYSNSFIKINGTPSQKITIKSRLPRQAILDGNGYQAVIRFTESSNISIEGFKITNPPTDGKDGRIGYYSLSGTQEGIQLANSWSNITIRENLFENIATRGIFTNCLTTTGCEGLLLENNLFTHIGRDTAGGDINPTGGYRYTIRYNYFGGSVDGVVFDSKIGGENLVEYNIFTGGKAEDGVDLKSVNIRGTDGGETVVQNNMVFAENNVYTGITVQNESNKVTVKNNYIIGSAKGPGQIWVHGRTASGTVLDGVKDITVSANYFKSSDAVGFKASLGTDSRGPTPLVNVVFSRNQFENVKTPWFICTTNCDVRSDANNLSPSAADFQPYSTLEESILSSLCKVFDVSEIRSAALLTRSFIQKIYTPGNISTCSQQLPAPENIRVAP